MTQSEFTYVYELSPKYREVVYSIGVRTDPSINNVESFAAIRYFEKRSGKRVEVAKVDNSAHDEGNIHIDRYYRELGADIKTFDTSIENYADADAYLERNWKRFARLYNTHHGNDVRKDGKNA